MVHDVLLNCMGVNFSTLNKVASDLGRSTLPMKCPSFIKSCTTSDRLYLSKI